jgi:hypothetical protein
VLCTSTLYVSDETENRILTGFLLSALILEEKKYTATNLTIRNVKE